MAMKIAKNQFTRKQLEQLEDLERQTCLNHTELARRPVDYYIFQIREHGYKSTQIPLPTIGTKEARLPKGTEPPVPSSWIKKRIRLSLFSDQESKTQPDTWGA